MRNSLLFATACFCCLAACSQADDGSSSSEVVGVGATSSAMADNGPSPAEEAVAAPPPVSLPKIAYVYGLAFELPSDDIGKLMRRHADPCEQQGPLSCRIVGMDLSEKGEDADTIGKLQLAVAAPNARALTALIEKEAEGLGADQTGTSIGSEEVSKSIVDAEARIRTRVELRDRLTEMLRNRKGEVKDLVEAERQVAQVNEEIDQARGWLAETRGRVAFSRMEIDYRSRPAPGSTFAAPIAAAFGSLGSILGFLTAAFLWLAAILAPIAGVLWAGRRIKLHFAGGGAEG